ncbi:MAG: nucleotidyltransferase domain-containing protein [Armatimonadia bacterium]
MIRLIQDNLDKIHDLCDRFHVKRLEVFGSASDGRFDPNRSDLDFIVEFEPLDWADHADAFIGLLLALQDLFGREVDLVTVKPPGEGNPYFWRVAQKTRQVIYERHHQSVPV